MKPLYKISLTLDEITWVREVLGQESCNYDTYKKFSDAEEVIKSAIGARSQLEAKRAEIQQQLDKVDADLTRYKA